MTVCGLRRLAAITLSLAIPASPALSEVAITQISGSVEVKTQSGTIWNRVPEQYIVTNGE